MAPLVDPGKRTQPSAAQQAVADEVHRAQTFAIANDPTREALEQIYDIRSQVEHIHHPLDALPGATTSAREELLYRRARQADSLARFAIRKVLADPALIETFKSDSKIDSFWKRPDDERAAAWGQRFDLSSVQ